MDRQLDLWSEARARTAVGGERTLEDLVLERWEALAAHRPVPCPVCGSAMTVRGGVRPMTARCVGCGSELC